MRKIALALALGLSLSACAQMQAALNVATLGTYQVNNPITKNTLYEVEAGLTVVVAGLNAYKKSCRAGVAGSNCKQMIAQIQSYTRQVPPLLNTLRVFVKTNDQINAVTVYQTILQLIGNAKGIAVANNIKVG